MKNKDNCCQHYCKTCEICEEHTKEVLTVTFRPSAKSVMTHFNVKYKDLSRLINLLNQYRIRIML